MMKRLLVLTGAAGVLYCTVLFAAPVDEHVRGTIVSVSPDTVIVRTDSGANVSGATTASKMTNGSVSAVTVTQGATVSTKMTNGNVSASTSGNGVKHLTLTYQGGEQSVVVPP